MANLKLRLDKNISAEGDELQDEETGEDRKGIHTILQEAFIIADNKPK